MSKSRLEGIFFEKLSKRQKEVVALTSRHGRLLTHPLTRWLARDVWIGLSVISLSLSLLLTITFPRSWLTIVERILLIW